MTTIYVGDIVRVDYPEHNRHGQQGEVIAIINKRFSRMKLVDEPFPIRVAFEGDSFEQPFKPEQLWVVGY